MWRRNTVCQSKQFSQFVPSFILAGALLLCFHAPVHAGQNVALAWDNSGDTNVAGYKIYFGTVSGHYTQSVDVGNVTNTVIAVPSAGSAYFFAAKTYDNTGAESSFSDEVVFAPPAAATLTSANSSNGQFAFTVTGTSGAFYVIEASTNLVDWFSVTTNTSPFTFVDTHAASMKQCFYRSVSL